MNKNHSKPLSARRVASLDSLRGFETAARLLSFTAAASELSITQSAVSRQIKSLEDSVGVPLFARFNRRLELTDAGERLYRVASRALADIMGTIDELQGPAAQVVTVTTSLSFATLWLVPRLARFRALHPEIDVRIAANDAIVALERERIDCAIRFCEPESAPAEARALMREEAFPVVSPALLNRKEAPLRMPADLVHHVLLRYDDARGQVPHVDWANWLALWKVGELKPAGNLTFSHYDQAISAAVEGEGIAIGRTAHVRRLIKQGKLVPLFDNRMAVPRQHFVVVARGSRHRPEVKAFTEWVLAEAVRD
ncbi:MAG: LysR substrate-binding domain-containing protein [Burkholderiales bacterium]